MNARRLAAALALALPCAALAQTANVADVGPRLGGVAAPNATVAGAEEPAALQANPAAPGFVARPSFQYLHEDRSGASGLGDAAFLTLPLGGLVPTLALDWIRPGDAPRYRRTSLGLALSDHRVFSVGGAWTWVHSPDRELDRVESYSFGLTVRPARWLSLAASAEGVGARLAGARLPARLDLGAAVRTWRDRLTLSAELLASDRATGLGDLDARALSFGVNAELWGGLAAFAQLQAPLRAGGETVSVFGVAFNAAHSGVTLGGSAGGPRDAWLVGVRSSAEAYLAPPRGAEAAEVDLAAALSPPRSLFFPGPRDPFGALVARLAAIRDDDAVRAVAITVDDLPLGWARAGELRAALAELAARKPVVAALRGGRFREYWVASAAQAIYLPPAGIVDVSGLSSATPFLREGLSRLGVAFDVVAAGAYKNAPDPLVRREMSPAQREASEAILDSIYGRVVADVARARGLDEARVRALVDGALYSADEAKEARLVDGVAWPDELDRLASARAGRKLALRGHVREAPREAQRWGPRPAIAVVPIEGAIVGGRSRSAPLTGALVGAETVNKEIRRAADDARVKAIVLRIDSPGGDAFASDLIWREISRARAKKPVVASMGDAAASGGYLVAIAAADIVAEPSTVTGSIGVFAVKPDLSGLLGKLGVNLVTLRRGEKADYRAATRPWSDAERALVQRQTDAFYRAFLGRVAEGRRLAPAEVERVAGGRVWTGAQAKERGLVDRLGTLADAIALARERAGLAADDAPEVLRFEPPRGFLSGLTRLAAEDGGPAGLERLAGALPEVRAAATLLEVGEAVALPVEWLGGDQGGADRP